MPRKSVGVVVGHITCPICGGEAEVCHGKKDSTLYWRGCECRFVKTFGPGGKKYIDAHMRPLETAPPEPDPDDDEKLPPTPAAEPSLLDSVIGWLSDE